MVRVKSMVREVVDGKEDSAVKAEACRPSLPPFVVQI